MAEPARPISLVQMVAYGSLALPLATIGLPLSIYLAPFYSGELGVPLAALGLAMVIARLSDVITDPLVGMASDRWRTRWGRRRIWLPPGIAMLMGGVWLLFNPPEGAGLVHFVIWVSIVYLGFTFTQLPYNAWGGELSGDYHERTRIVSVRQAFGLTGLIAATLLPAIVLGREGATAGDVLGALAIAMAILLPLFGLVVMLLVPEPPPPPSARQAELPLLDGFRIALGNGSFRIIVAALFLGYVAETFRITITLFFARDAIGVPNIGIIYVWYFLTGLAAVPFWAWLAKKIGKHKALALAFCLVLATNVAVFFLEYGQVVLFTAIFLVKGFCFGSLELLPAALVADVVDVETARSRARRQGLFFAFFTMTNKIGQAIGQGLSLILLGAIGYAANGDNTSEAIESMKALYGLLPAALLVPAIFLMLGYRLDARRHGRIAAALARRQQRLDDVAARKSAIARGSP
jgi:glycoside/pentoside/hexuronide:cation symporter, GPH family